ncbi:MAG: helix-turn-helix domain-containing protein [Firmicutes bacterium]|nr:helix-turn-helix domain-containing protein [Bacillota bacterium]
MKVPDSEIQVHLGCFTYSKFKDLPLIEIKHFEKGTTHQIVTTSNEMVVVYKGALNYSFGQTQKQAKENAIVMIPVKKKYTIHILEDVTLFIFRLDIDLGFCDHFSFEMLNREKKLKEKRNNVDEMHFLYANDVIREYFAQLLKVLSSGLYCGYLLKIKLQELLFLLRYYYPMEELKAFFASILSDDLEFSLHVMKYYDHNTTVQDLAKKMHYSLTGFEKRFVKVFGMPPFQWLQVQRAQAVYHEINCSTKTFAELGYEFGFSSPSHFNSFCKKMFNESPGSIRKKA